MGSARNLIMSVGTGYPVDVLRAFLTSYKREVSSADLILFTNFKNASIRPVCQQIGVITVDATDYFAATEDLGYFIEAAR